MSKSPKAPPPPDYASAAKETAAGNLDAARQATAANRVNQITPYGNLTYSQAPRTFDQAGYDSAMSAYNNAPKPSGLFGILAGNSLNKMPNKESFYSGKDDGWAATTTLSPAQQQLLDQQNKTSLGLSHLADKGLGYVSDQLDKPFDMSGLPEMPTAGGDSWNRAYQSIIDRDQPGRDKSDAALAQQMANQGISLGSEAWRSAMDDRNRGYNDFRLGAQQQAGQEDTRVFSNSMAGRQHGLQERAFLRNEPLNMLNAVRTGSQVTNPTFSAVPQQQTTQGPDMMGAANGQNTYNMGLYNSQVASDNSTMGSLTGLAGAGIGAYGTYAGMLAL
jgi:hypothetical protein